MISGQQIMQEEKFEEKVDPKKKIDVEAPKSEGNSQNEDKSMVQQISNFGKQAQKNIFPSISNHIFDKNEVNPLNLQQQESRPSPPIDESVSQSLSNPMPGKVKPLPLSNELLRLTKKSTTTVSGKQRKQRQKKIRCFVTDFQPYLPNFLDEMHRQHFKSIIRIGENYQVEIPSQPKFESLHRPMNNLRIWKGSQEKFSTDAFKKFREIYGQNRTEEELILLKNRLQCESWDELVKEITVSKQTGKKPGIVIANNSIVGATTRNK